MKNHAKKLLVALVAISSLFLLGCPQPDSPDPSPEPTYTVSFESNGGSVIAPITKKSGSQIETAPSTTQEGFNFEGWYSDTGLTQKVTFPYTVTATVTLYAKWFHTAESRIVSFNTNEGSKIPDSIVENGKSIEVPKHPTKDDFHFEGWYSDDKTFNDKVDFPYKPTKNVILHAKWLPVVGSHTIVFDTNGGSAISNSAVEDGKTIEEPTDPTRKNYTFEGWYLDTELTPKVAFPYTVTKEITLYAKWAENTKYTVSFETDGGTAVTAITKYVGEKIETAPSTTKEGFNFEGWYSDATFTSTNKVTFPYTVAATETLYAKWVDKTTSWVVKFATNGGSTIPDSIVTKDSTIEKPQSIRKNYTLEGWYSDANFTSTNKVAFPYKVTKEITLYAKWTENTKFTVKFETNGGTSVTAITKYVGETIGTANTTKPNYTLEGWYFESGLTTKVNFPHTVTASITLYAKWVERQSFMVSFNNNGGKPVSPIVKYDGERIETSPETTRANYTFGGWHLESGLTNKVSFPYTPTADITLHAKWTEKAKYTVSFETDGGTAVTAITKYVGEKIETAPITTKVGNILEGWYLESGLTNKITFPYAPTASITLYAKWTGDATVLSYDSLGIILHDRANFSAVRGQSIKSTQDKLLRSYNDADRGPVKELLLPFNGQYYFYTKTADYSNVDISYEENLYWGRKNYIEFMPQNSVGLFNSATEKIKAEKKTEYINYLTEMYADASDPPTQAQLGEMANALTVTLNATAKTAIITGKEFIDGALQYYTSQITDIGTTTIDPSLITEAENAIYTFLNPPPISGIQYDNIGEKLHEGNFSLSEKQPRGNFTEIGKIADKQGYMTDFAGTVEYQIKQGELYFVGSGDDFSMLEPDGWNSLQKQSFLLAFIPENTRGIWNNDVMHKALYWARLGNDFVYGNKIDLKNRDYFVNSISVTISENGEAEISFRWGKKADTWTDANTTVYTWKYSDIGKTMLDLDDIPQSKIALVKELVDYMNPQKPTTQLSERNIGAYLKQSNVTVVLSNVSWSQTLSVSGETIKLTGSGFEIYEIYEILQNEKRYLVQRSDGKTFVDVFSYGWGTMLRYNGLFSSFLPDDIAGLFNTNGTIKNPATYKSKLPALIQNDVPKSFKVLPDFTNKTVVITGLVRQDGSDVLQTETYTNIGTTTVDVPGWVYTAINNSGL